MDERFFYLPFVLCPSIGPSRFAKLLTYFDTAPEAFGADEKSLVASGIGKFAVGSLIEFRKTFSLEKCIQDLEKKHISFVTTQESDYPDLLKETSYAPPVLFYKGSVDALTQRPTIGVVGTRKISSYGSSVTQSFVKELVDAGCVIVSGLAFGVDSVAHEATLAAKGITIAVLGSGVDICSPVEHQRLYDRIIAEQGVVVSAFPPGTAPSRFTFPARNSIIAGLSEALLVTEAAADSGSLITATSERSLNRPVCAVPGPITHCLSVGTNTLLRDGSQVATCGNDVLHAIKRKAHGGTDRLKNALSQEQQEILEALTCEDLHFDQIVRTIGKPASYIGSQLSMLELQGYIKNNGGIYSIV